VTCRYTVPGDTSWLLSSLRDDRLSAWQKLLRATEFVAWFLNPFAKSDLWFPGDRRLYWLEWSRFLRGIGR